MYVREACVRQQSKVCERTAAAAAVDERGLLRRESECCCCCCRHRLSTPAAPLESVSVGHTYTHTLSHTHRETERITCVLPLPLYSRCVYTCCLVPERTAAAVASRSSFQPLFSSTTDQPDTLIPFDRTAFELSIKSNHSSFGQRDLRLFFRRKRGKEQQPPPRDRETRWRIPKKGSNSRLLPPVTPRKPVTRPPVLK